MSEPIKRGVCPYCGIDAGSGPYAHTKHEDCIRALKEAHGKYRRRVTNEIGGVIGYRLQLSAEETEKLLRAIESA